MLSKLIIGSTRGRWKNATIDSIADDLATTLLARLEGNSNRGKKREGLECYNYYKIGHYVRDYRGRKLNIILVKEPIDEANDGRGAYDVLKLVKEPKTELDYKAMY
ncbi:hypothetical protein D0864_16784 [Hortaea werneckii]|uniref:Uncharacterized protein n=1 Tax=Hortaea werneckii TaxID=91943 RepID=A0A3M7B139_HORWE|nr:hypothetical protein D0864_16784 [Hortaea werneckii]